METTDEELQVEEVEEAEEPIPYLPRTSSIAFNYLHLDPEKVLSAFGKYGRFQMLTYLLTSGVHMLMALNMLVMPFITKQPTFGCDFEPQPHWEYAEIDGCHVRDGNNWTVNCLQIPGAKYNYTDASSSLAAEYNLVCEESGAVDHATSIFLFGGMLVSPIITQLSDLFGRRWTFLLPLYMAVLANLVCAAAPNYTTFLIFRFISGVTTTSFSTIGWVLCMESVALEFRSLIPLVTTAAWVFGYILAGALHLVIEDWRLLYLAVTLPGILTIPYYWLVPESLHWLITKRKKKMVKKYIRTCSKYNKREIALHECRTAVEEAVLLKERTAIDIFTHPDLFGYFLINSYILIVMNGTYWALSLFSTELSDDGITGYFLSGIVELPAGLLSVGLLVFLGRKTVSFLSLALQSVFMCCALYIPVNTNMRMIFPLLTKSTNAIVWSSQLLLYTEATPTSVRNVFCGMVYFVGEIGSVAAPYLKRLEAIDKNAPALLIAMMSLLAALLVLLVPDTKGIRMPEDIDDFNGGPLLRLLRRKKPRNGTQIELEMVLPQATVDQTAAEELK
ncbi:unnamed protein product [Caenorhabditis auriculariae]|uniref:Major facilitator superfamily (MFS) profile domain-containing protein n=1 Tax=Caenorhabditis auriculariae TaxID=2777116 RepID=A0A8S1GUC1_9PELO|nr:unnamed protein product [Caenorhabditis auriculariae]